MCYRPIDPTTSERVDCSHLIDEATNQTYHDKAQKIFAAGKGRKAVQQYRHECRTRWLASAQGSAAVEEGEVAQAHSEDSSSAGSAAEEHGLGISESSASEDMIEYDSDSDSDWRHDLETSESDSDLPTPHGSSPAAYTTLCTQRKKKGVRVPVYQTCAHPAHLVRPLLQTKLCSRAAVVYQSTALIESPCM
jgi:hypothetical protein